MNRVSRHSLNVHVQLLKRILRPNQWCLNHTLLEITSILCADKHSVQVSIEGSGEVASMDVHAHLSLYCKYQKLMNWLK